MTFLNFLKFELPFSRTRIFRNSPLFKINWLKVGSVLGPLRGIYIQVFPSPLLGLSFIGSILYRNFPLLTFFYRKHALQELSFTVVFLQEASFTGTILYRNSLLQETSFTGTFLYCSFFYRKHPLQELSFTGTFSFRNSPLLAISFYRNHIFEVSIFPTIPGQQSFSP